MKNMTKNYYQHFMCSCKTFLRKLLIESKKKDLQFLLGSKNLDRKKNFVEKQKLLFFLMKIFFFFI